jgi:ATP-dependent Clp protease protease subunit
MTGRWPAGSRSGHADNRDGASSVHDRLFEQRMVFLWGELDDATGAHLAAQLMTLDATGDGPIQLHIDSPGGTLEAAFCLIDVIDLLGVDVIATCVGQAGGPAVGPLAVARRRRATPHARFQLKSPVAQMTGSARDLDAWARHHRSQIDRFSERLAEAVGRQAATVADDLATGRFLDATEAMSYGLVDEICSPAARVLSLRAPRFGFRP